jgi:ribosomal protein S18 acetylase RimI-like enzyme
MKNTDVLEIYKLGKKDFAKKDEYSWDWSIKEIKKFLEKSNLGIICKDRKIVGFILVGKNYSSQKPKTAWLRYVFVDKKHRREKIASKLLDYAIRKLKELGKKDLEADVYTKNNSSIKFFKSHGFKTEESYYIMVRKIK